MKIFIIPAILLMCVNAFAAATKCVDFTGEWSGVCTSLDGSTYNFSHSAKQNKCGSIEWDGSIYDFGKIYKGAGSTGNVQVWSSFGFKIKNQTTLLLRKTSKSYNSATGEATLLTLKGEGVIVKGELHTVVKGSFKSTQNGKSFKLNIKDNCVFYKQ